VFGTASGFKQQDFWTVWHRLFKLAGLEYGRDKGLVWHTLRHEFCSRTAENTGDPVVAQELARHKDLRTTQGLPACPPGARPRGRRLAQSSVEVRTSPVAARVMLARTQT
jgi:integrase